MEVYEKINLLLKSQNLSKREFALKLRNLSAKLKSTGEVPSEKTIYKYLNGDVSIPIELVTYIAEALDVSEQELFDHSFEAKCRLCRMMFKTSSGHELQKLKSNFTILTELKEKEGIAQDRDYEHQVARLIELMPYAPYPLLKKINLSLARIADIAENEQF